MDKVKLGARGPAVGALGLGCMGMSDFYGPADRQESLATVGEALDRGLDLFDTGNFYGSGHNEILLREAVAGRPRHNFIYSVTFGAMRDPKGGFVGFAARPAAVLNSLAYSLKRLDTDYIDIYRPTRLDATVPIEETVGATAHMVEAGYVRHIAVSEVGPETLRRAAATHPILDLQIEYSLIARGIEAAILPLAGARTRAQLVESLGALAVTLTPAERALLDAIPPPGAAAGDRYDSHGMALLDSERGGRPAS